MAQLDNFLSAMRQSMQDAAPTEAQPTAVDRLLEVVHAAARGQRPLQEAQDALTRERQRAVLALSSIAGRVQAVSAADAEVTAALERAQALGTEFDADVTALESALRSQDGPALEAVSQRLKQTADDLFAAMNQLEGTLVHTEAQNSSQVQVSEHYGALHDACADVANDRMPIDEWRTYVDSVSSELAMQRSRLAYDLNSLQPKLKKNAWACDLTGEVQAGLDDTNTGLQRIATFEQTHDVTDLEEGWTMMMDGVVRMQRAIKVLASRATASNDVVVLGED